MKLSTKGQYATRAMLDLALHYGEGYVLLKDVARRQAISDRYLEHIIIPLKMAGLVRSVRGAKGGFELAKPPGDINVGEIIQVCEGSIAPVECVDNAAVCSRASFCVARDVWAEMEKAMRGVLQAITLQDLAARQRLKGRHNGGSYEI